MMSTVNTSIATTITSTSSTTISTTTTSTTTISSTLSSTAITSAPSTTILTSTPSTSASTSTSTTTTFNTNEYLTHYWPITTSAMNDQIGTADMFQGAFTNFTFDRFNCPNSALALNGGWTQIPSGVYFNTPEFTISVWVFPLQVGYLSFIIDFGNGYNADNIILKHDSGGNDIPALRINNGSQSIGTAQSTGSLTLSKWQLLTATFDSSIMKIYINGIQKGSLISVYTLPTITRTLNYIGKSDSSTYSYSYLDDLRFYKESLSQSEIIDLMNAPGQSNCILMCNYLK